MQRPNRRSILGMSKLITLKFFSSFKLLVTERKANEMKDKQTNRTKPNQKQTQNQSKTKTTKNTPQFFFCLDHH